ncbi:hypothetical protein [Neisseria animalis]|uniref:Uncharacterized protein n=1 Tax=Neisseria animalis TaxID=492 RepID=A0A5P3MST7_NEIAN|nr:hypothetical protein [Neisseria animalis]QEY24676.1 hypothetical protein D0T90_09560 [Neisseria animalis]ROW31458.1 hypothetical protein CGZ60_10125 [Neisseria animalis]VEE07619.1 Uncharacterised protein [Neisseria animalis]
MFKRPEELIVLVLALLWVALTYFGSASFGADAATVFLITGLTLAWAAVCFLLWQRNLSRMIWPLFLGALAACWWPLLDWYAVKDIPAAGNIPTDTPWYAGWTFKGILAAIPVIIGYLAKWKRARRLKREQAANFPAR